MIPGLHWRLGIYVSRKKRGWTSLLLCSGCVNTLKEANHVLKQSDSKRRKVNKILDVHGHHFRGTVEVTHILDVLYQDTVVEKIVKETVRDIPLRVGCHYGCHYFRPPKIMYPEELSAAESYVPVKMDHLLSIIGVVPMEYSRKFLCCGSPWVRIWIKTRAMPSQTRKLSYMRERTSRLSRLSAPCFEQFDMGQIVLARKTKERQKYRPFILPNC